MNMLLRKLTEWKGKHRAAQVIVFEGAEDVDRAKSFLKGTIVGILLTFCVFALTAPTSTDAESLTELGRRAGLLRDADRQLQQAINVADACLTTADHMQKTLASYQSYLREPH